MHFLCFRKQVKLFDFGNNSRDSDAYYRNLAYQRKHGVTGVVNVTRKTFAIVKKDERTKELLKNAILGNKFLADIPEDRIDELVSVMYPENVKPDTRLIHEGDVGSYMYISEEGSFNIYIGNTYYGSFGPGVVFGELALLYNTKRLSSIDADTRGKVWVLDREDFQSIMVIPKEEQAQYHIEMLKRLSIFKDLSEEVLFKICDLLVVEFFCADTYIVNEGETGDKFYIVVRGNVRITKNKSDGLEEEVMILTKGDYFGEKALYEGNESRRQANAIALSPGAECYTITRNAFLEYLGDLDSIKNRNWDLYKEKVAEECWSLEFRQMKLSDFQVEGVIGVGSYGRVELVVTGLMPDVSFARKKVKKHLISQGGLQTLIFNERNNLRLCDSPFVCKLYRTFKDNRYLYFLMEVCLGGDLRTALHKNGRFEDHAVRFITACLVQGLAHVHSLGLVYRDLKPENVVTDHRGYAKLTDFGSSKRIGAFRTNTFIGTPEYVAPEMIQSKGYNKAVDIWALGIVVYELLLGRTPFQDVNDWEVYNKILSGFNANNMPSVIKRPVRDLIVSLLESDPNKRLGHLRNGVADIRNHKWFSSFSWQDLQNQTLLSPIQPTVKSFTDLRNFEKYPPDRRPAQMDLSNWDANF